MNETNALKCRDVCWSAVNKLLTHWHHCPVGRCAPCI